MGENAVKDGNFVSSLLVADKDDLKQTMRVYVNPSTHALKVVTNEDDLGEQEIDPRDGNRVRALLGVSSVDNNDTAVVAGDSNRLFIETT